MLVVPKDQTALEGYFALTPGVQYRVLGIAIELSNRVGPEALLIETFKGGQFCTIPFAKLSIIDDSHPEEWSGALLTQKIAYPTVIFGPAELHDPERYVRLHDQNETAEDRTLVLEYLDKYGGNISLSPEEDMLHSSEYLKAANAIEAYMRNTVTEESRNGQYIQEYAGDYMENLRTVATIILETITKKSNPREKDFLAKTLANYARMLEPLERVDGVSLPKDLAEISKDTTYVSDYSKLTKKATEKQYVIQQY